VDTDTCTFRYRILIVDDEPSLRQVGKLLLEAQGYEVHCASDGFGGLATLKKALPDLIISDLRMPNMNGFEFLSVVRRRSRRSLSSSFQVSSRACLSRRACLRMPSSQKGDSSLRSCSRRYALSSTSSLPAQRAASPIRLPSG